jgi:hypothetical protein
MQVLLDDDAPRRPDPLHDDLDSAQARRALFNSINWGHSREDQGAEPQRPWPVVVHG